jgi:hypothetical protein
MRRPQGTTPSPSGTEDNQSHTCSSFDVPCRLTRAASVNDVGSANVETISLDPGQYRIGPAINSSHHVAGMHGALTDKRPWPEFFREIGAGSPGRETRQVLSGPGLEDEYMHCELNVQRMRRVPLQEL